MNCPTQTLPEDTPLMFQWVPSSYGASVPNNKQYPYKQRLVDWAEREPQREIYLVVNGVGFEQGQLEKLKKDLEEPASNIQVVDFLEVSKDNDFEDFKIYPRANQEPVKLSEILARMYCNSQDLISYTVTNLGFSNILDAMRLEILLNIEKITSRKDAIYFDFDILPKGKQQIGAVNIPENILLLEGSPVDTPTAELENPIIAVNSKSQDTIKQMIKYAEYDLNRYFQHRFSIPKSCAYGTMVNFIKLCYYDKEGKLSINQVLSNQQAFNEGKKTYSLLEDLSRKTPESLILTKELRKKFSFEHHCKNVEVTSDKTWEKTIKSIYSGEELPLIFNNAHNKTTTKSDLLHIPNDLDNVDTESTPVSDDYAKVDQEITELSISKELHEDLYRAMENYCNTYADFYIL